MVLFTVNQLEGESDNPVSDRITTTGLASDFPYSSPGKCGPQKWKFVSPEDLVLCHTT